MLQQRGFVHGAMLLAGAAIVSKLLGSVYTIVLQNIIGDHGMGLFQMAYPIYATLLAIATAGFPVAISKLVSERIAYGDLSGARQTFRIAFYLLSLAGILCFCLLFFGADVSAQIAGDQDAAWAIRAIAPALLIVPVMSAVRGYFQGFQRMEPTASSQVVEQLIRVGTILGLAVWLMKSGYGQAIAAAGAAFGAVTGALASLLLLGYFWRHHHPEVASVRNVERLSSLSLSKQLLYYAFPISLGALVVPLMNNVDVISVVNLLKTTGQSQHLATTEFGLLTGRAFKLMMLPTTLAAGIGIALMPAVSEAFTLGYRKLMWDRVDLAIRLTVMLSLPAAAGLALLATPINIALFKDAAGSETIRIMAYATVFASLQMTIAAVLQGAGWVYLPVLNLLIAGVVKLAGNLLLVPKFGIQGAAAATVISYATATVLNVWSMRRCVGVGFDWTRWIVKPVLATFIMAGAVFAMERQFTAWGGLDSHRTWIGLCSIFMCICGFAVYSVSLLVSGAMSKEELQSVPKVGPQLVLWCSKVGLIK